MAGALVGLVAPTLAVFAEGLVAPHLFVGTAIAAAATQVGALALALTLPSASPGMIEAQAAELVASQSQSQSSTDWNAVAGATFAGVAAWLVMTMLMA